MSHLRHALLAVALLASPASAETTLTYAWPANVGPLNPHLYAPNQMFAQAMVYEGLVAYAEGGRIVPWLAESWTLSPDGRAYTFRLRDGVAFSDGMPFDAPAAKLNFDAVLANRKRHEWLELAAQIDGAEALDARTLRLTLKNAYYPAIQELALIRPFRFLSPAAFPESGRTAEGIKAPAGTGPWKLIETRKGEHDLFARNDRYWGAQAKFDRVLVKVIPDPNTRVLAFETGEVDLILGGADAQISADAFARLRGREGITTAVSPPLATRMVALNSGRGPTAERAVRQAILRAVDKDAIVKGILYGLEPRADALFAANFPYADIGLARVGFDPAEAARLLESAGWKRGGAGPIRRKDGAVLRVELCFVGNDPQQKSIAEVMQADLRKVGIDAVLVGEEANANAARQKDGSFHLIFGDTWGAPYDPHAFASAMRVPSHADFQAQSGLPMKAEIDRWIGEALVSTDEEIRRDLYRRVLTVLHDQAVYLPVSHPTAILAHGPKLTGVGFGATKHELPFAAIGAAIGVATGLK